MKRFVQQFRFYGENNEKNYPKNLNGISLNNGDIFTPYAPIVSLGIQATPGTKFYLNGNIEDAIIVGNTGIYELNLEGQILISALSFERQSIVNITNNPAAFLIVDILYEKEG